MHWATNSTACLSLVLGLAACDSYLRDSPSAQAQPSAADASAQVTVEDPPGFVDDPAEQNVDPAVTAKAKLLWETSCASCHGSYGDGDGSAGKGLDPAPRDFHEHRWQAEAADEHIKKVILEGGGAAGLSPAMAANLELRGKPEVLDELVVLLRGFPHWKPSPADPPTPAK